nr:zinc finger, CCHC-type [Tanacetum cinerariifolium]
MHTVAGDGVVGIKRRCRDLSSDGFRNMATSSGRGRLKEDLKSSTWRRRQDYKATPSPRSTSTWEDITIRFLALLFPPGRTAKLRNDILMFQQHQGESVSEAWTRFKDLLQKVLHHGIDRWLQIQIYYDHVSFHLKCEIDRAAVENFAIRMPINLGKLLRTLPSRTMRDGTTQRRGRKNDDDNETTGDSIEKPDRSDAEIPLKEADKEDEAKNGTKNELIKSAKKELTLDEEEEAVEAPNSQLVGYYMKHRINEKIIEELVENHRFNDSPSAAIVGKMKRKTYNLSPRRLVYEAILKKNITKKRKLEEILKYPDEKRPFILGTPFLTTSKAVIKFDRGTRRGRKNDDDNETTGDSIQKPDRSDAEIPLKEADKEDEAENGTKNEPIKSAKKELTLDEEEEVVEAPNSQLVGYYMKHRINEKLIEELVENHRFNDSPSAAMDEKRPFILGTPFLTTAKAVIKFDKGTVTLRSGKSKMSFHRIPESLCKIEKEIKNYIEPIAPTMTMNRLVLEWEERIKLHQKRRWSLTNR